MHPPWKWSWQVVGCTFTKRVHIMVAIIPHSGVSLPLVPYSYIPKAEGAQVFHCYHIIGLDHVNFPLINKLVHILLASHHTWDGIRTKLGSNKYFKNSRLQRSLKLGEVLEDFEPLRSWENIASMIRESPSTINWLNPSWGVVWMRRIRAQSSTTLFESCPGISTRIWWIWPWSSWKTTPKPSGLGFPLKLHQNWVWGN